MNIRSMIKHVAAIITAVGMLLASMAGAVTALAEDSKPTTAVDGPTKPVRIMDNLYQTRYTGDYKLDDYLSANAGGNDDYLAWLRANLNHGKPIPLSTTQACTTLAVTDTDTGHDLMVRNMDWYPAVPGMMVATAPTDGYRSVGVAPVMTGKANATPTTDELETSANIAPLTTMDGVNEKGLSAAILQIHRWQAPNDGKPSISQLAVVRLLLDKAATVDEAISLLGRYDIAAYGDKYASLGGLHYALADATGGKTDPQPGKTDEKINVRDNGFTRDGYMFVTWNTQADCKGKAVDPGDEWTLQGSGTLYACWAGTAQTLAYHGNGATGGNTAVQSGKTGDELTTNANGFTRDGYTFVRWDTAKDGSGTAYGEGKNGVSQYVMKPAGNDLYAIWKANPATIQYRNDWPNTTGSTPDTTGNTGDTVTVSQNSFDRPGYTFTGWSTSKRGDPSLNPGDKHTLEPGTTTVWAQWKANPAHLVYNSNIGSIGSETKTVDGVVDQTVKTLGNPFDRPGYTFSGWNTQADGKGKAYDPGADYTLTANDKSTPKNTSVLYAQWTINKVTLKFDPNGGVGGYPSINTDAFGSVTIPKDAKEPKVTRPGFRFTGWSLKKTPDKDETLLTPGKDTVSMPAEGEVAVYAQWEPAMTTLPFTGGNAQIPTIWLWAGLAFLIIAAGAFSPMIRLRMGAGSKGRHAGTPTIGRHSR